MTLSWKALINLCGNISSGIQLNTFTNNSFYVEESLARV